MTLESKKIIAVILLLVFLLLGIIVVRNRNSYKPTAPKTAAVTEVAKKEDTGVMGFAPDKMSLKSGQTAEVTVYINARGGIVNGADAILNYDPGSVEILEVNPSQYFQNYPLKKIDSLNGVVKVMGYEAANPVPLNSKAPFFNLTLKGKKQGSFKLEISFKKGRTNLSTLVERNTSKNLLGEVLPLTVVVE